MRCTHFDRGGRFIQDEYGRQPCFSSFLPGIAGPWGIPAWCNYNNRGQAVCSFGIRDKDHAILEFLAAQHAYQRNALTAFRTFIKEDGRVIEPFADGKGRLCVSPNLLSIAWRDEHFSVAVRYFTLPGERIGGLCREFRLRRNGGPGGEIELLDGLATVVPYGIGERKLKLEAQLSAAWTRVEWDLGMSPIFRAAASLEDGAEVKGLQGRNFSIAITRAGEVLPAIVSPKLVFGWDTSLREARHFSEAPLASLLEETKSAAVYGGDTWPCCFSAWRGRLGPGECLSVWEFFGQAESEAEQRAFCAKAASADYFRAKRAEAEALAEEIRALARCRTAKPVFDGYVAQSFMDNALRGGLPLVLDRKDPTCPPIYLYSRKHGDAEREYNSFCLMNEYFSQGDAHFRDLCQNRRSDVWLEPASADFNLQLFFELLQADGYNPLVLEAPHYRLKQSDALPASLPPPCRDEAKAFFAAPFSIGALARRAELWPLEDKQAFLAEVIRASSPEPNAVFAAGYWSDHWTYLLDLLENVLAVFPERRRAILFGEARYRWFSGPASVRPQAERYHWDGRTLRQYACLDITARGEKWLRTRRGTCALSSAGEKLLLLSALKFATLDLSGAALEMEGGRPGWCDALNGLPALLGSSVADACELLRLLDFLLEALADCPAELFLYAEIAALLRRLYEMRTRTRTAFDTWLAGNAARDAYRASVRQGFSGERASISRRELRRILTALESELREALRALVAENGGICPTYFYYEATGEKQRSGLPSGLSRQKMPLFLEGPARWLKTRQPHEDKASMVRRVRQSALYDDKLKMYKICADLSVLSHEVGRIRAFPPGWLENESIWLHMEYKYLLALLENDLFEDFFADFATAAIPFLEPERYGRSTLENVSFLVSSAGADGSAHGRGYQARLSGSTAEFLSIWRTMLLGPRPFTLRGERLRLHFRPALPALLLPRDAAFRATLLGHTELVYHIGGLRELRPGSYRVCRHELFTKEGEVIRIDGDGIEGEWAEKVRSGDLARIEVYFSEQAKSEVCGGREQEGQSIDARGTDTGGSPHERRNERWT